MEFPLENQGSIRSAQWVQIHTLLQRWWQPLKVGFALIGGRGNLRRQTGQHLVAQGVGLFAGWVVQGHTRLAAGAVAAIHRDRLLVVDFGAALAADLRQAVLRQR